MNGSQTTNGHPSNGQEQDTKPQHANLMISLPDNVGSLARALQVFEQHQLEITHIESRPAVKGTKGFQILTEVNVASSDSLTAAISALKKISLAPVEQLNSSQSAEKNLKTEGQSYTGEYLAGYPGVPWFARTLDELIAHQGKTLQSGVDLDADHPSFKDEKYRARRKMFADISYSYVLGQPIPRVDYNDQENKTWGAVYRGLTSLYPTHACATYNEMFPLLIEHCGYGPDKIPQMDDVSKFVHSRTGFRLRPISGLVSFRDFLAGLAFRVFHATQYIRHSDDPGYTPEPDVCHELLGHVPLFLDPVFAQFSQEIGLASLGAPEEWIDKLGNLYWYTVEFGLCHEKAGNRVYGGALLSSFSELQHSLTDSATLYPLETEKVAATSYPITRFQDAYFVAESFQDVRDKLAVWLKQMPRPFTLRYNPYTETVEILNEKHHIHNIVRDIQTELKVLSDAVDKLK